MSAENLAEGTNFGERLPAVPYGSNNKGYSVLMAAVVNNGQIERILPLHCEDNGDGTATLIVRVQT